MVCYTLVWLSASYRMLHTVWLSASYRVLHIGVAFCFLWVATPWCGFLLPMGCYTLVWLSASYRVLHIGGTFCFLQGATQWCDFLLLYRVFSVLCWYNCLLPLGCIAVPQCCGFPYLLGTLVLNRIGASVSFLLGSLYMSPSCWGPCTCLLPFGVLVHSALMWLSSVTLFDGSYTVFGSLYSVV